MSSRRAFVLVEFHGFMTKYTVIKYIGQNISDKIFFRKIYWTQFSVIKYFKTKYTVIKYNRTKFIQIIYIPSFRPLSHAIGND